MESQGQLDLIYEAALDWNAWANVLNSLSAESEAVGATLFTLGGDQTRALTTPGLDRSMEEFIRGGWDVLNPLPGRFLKKGYRDFKTDRDIQTPDEMRTTDFFRGFRAPWGLRGFAGLIVSNVQGHLMALSIETPESFNPAMAARLQQLAPHIKRSVSLAMRLQNTALESTMGTLEQIGCPAAAVTASGRLVVANALFQALPSSTVVDARSRLVFGDVVVDRRFMKALAAIRQRRFSDIQAIPHRRAVPGPAVIYCLPLVGNIRDVFISASALVVVRSGVSGGGSTPHCSCNYMA